MKQILVIGAGRSSSFLIKYLLSNAAHENWQITVGDMSLELANEKVEQCEYAKAIRFDVNDEGECARQIQKVDIVISMLPASMHILVAQQCIRFKKHLVTASYVSDEMRKLNNDAIKAGVCLLNECGLDPGIDHASAMKMIGTIKNKGGAITSFKSYTGGLLTEESCGDNPWKYKIAWNPQNIVLAGKDGAQFLEKKMLKRLSYTELFQEIMPISVGKTIFEGYANRDSIPYKSLYGLNGIDTLIRGTLRYPGYCKAWSAIINMGLTDTEDKISTNENLTFKNWANHKKSWDLNSWDEHIQKCLAWLGLFGDDQVPFELFAGEWKYVTSAQILQHLLEQKWGLEEGDKDMIVMQHELEYKVKGQDNTVKVSSSLKIVGENQTYTAMAKTVGLPLGIACKLILQNQLKERGVILPTIPSIYMPMLTELESYGITFNEVTD